MTVLLGIDLGDRRIGLATGDTATGKVTPLTTIRRGSAERDSATIRRICAEQGASELVVGLPLHMDDSESQQSRITRAWVSAVDPLVDLPISLRDERLTTEVARARVGRQPRGRAGGAPSPSTLRHWRARIDREAAAGIVQSELDARAADTEAQPS